MRIDRRLIGFGVFLVTVGVTILAVRQGLVQDEAVRRAWSLWPLILIGVGLSVILAGRPGAAIGGLIAVVTLGTILGVAVGSGTFVPGICTGDRDHGSAFGDTGAVLASPARISVEQECGDLHVNTADGTTWNLGGTSSDGRPPAVTATASELRIRSDKSAPFDLAGSGAWDLVLPRDPQVDLHVQANAGDARLVLGGAHLTSLSVQRNAGSIAIDLREIAAIGRLEVEVNAGTATIRLPTLTLDGTVTANAGSVAFCRPAAAGLRIDLRDSVAASNDFEAHGLQRSGDRWETPGFATAAVRITLEVDANAASLSLDPAGPCAG